MILDYHYYYRYYDPELQTSVKKSLNFQKKIKTFDFALIQYYSVLFKIF